MTEASGEGKEECVSWQQVRQRVRQETDRLLHRRLPRPGLRLHAHRAIRDDERSRSQSLDARLRRIADRRRQLHMLNGPAWRSNLNHGWVRHDDLLQLLLWMQQLLRLLLRLHLLLLL